MFYIILFIYIYDIELYTYIPCIRSYIYVNMFLIIYMCMS